MERQNGKFVFDNFQRLWHHNLLVLNVNNRVERNFYILILLPFGDGHALIGRKYHQILLNVFQTILIVL